MRPEGILIDVETLRVAIYKITRPWIKESRGIPPMVLLGGECFLEAIVRPLQQLLAYGAD